MFYAESYLLGLQKPRSQIRRTKVFTKLRGTTSMRIAGYVEIPTDLADISVCVECVSGKEQSPHDTKVSNFSHLPVVRTSCTINEALRGIVLLLPLPPCPSTCHVNLQSSIASYRPLLGQTPNPSKQNQTRSYSSHQHRRNDFPRRSSESVGWIFHRYVLDCYTSCVALLIINSSSTFR